MKKNSKFYPDIEMKKPQQKPRLEENERMDRDRREQAKQQQKQQMQQMQRLSQQNDNDAPQMPLFGVPKKLSSAEVDHSIDLTLGNFNDAAPLFGTDTKQFIGITTFPTTPIANRQMPPLAYPQPNKQQSSMAFNNNGLTSSQSSAINCSSRTYNNINNNNNNININNNINTINNNNNSNTAINNVNSYQQKPLSLSSSSSSSSSRSLILAPPPQSRVTNSSSSNSSITSMNNNINNNNNTFVRPSDNKPFINGRSNYASGQQSNNKHETPGLSQSKYLSQKLMPPNGRGYFSSNSSHSKNNIPRLATDNGREPSRKPTDKKSVDEIFKEVLGGLIPESPLDGIGATPRNNEMGKKFNMSDMHLPSKYKYHPLSLPGPLSPPKMLTSSNNNAKPSKAEPSSQVQPQPPPQQQPQQPPPSIVQQLQIPSTVEPQPSVTDLDVSEDSDNDASEKSKPIVPEATSPVNDVSSESSDGSASSESSSEGEDEHHDPPADVEVKVEPENNVKWNLSEFLPGGIQKSPNEAPSSHEPAENTKNDDQDDDEEEDGEIIQRTPHSERYPNENSNSSVLDNKSDVSHDHDEHQSMPPPAKVKNLSNTPDKAPDADLNSALSFIKSLHTIQPISSISDSDDNVDSLTTYGAERPKKKRPKKRLRPEIDGGNSSSDESSRFSESRRRSSLDEKKPSRGRSNNNSNSNNTNSLTPKIGRVSHEATNSSDNNSISGKTKKAHKSPRKEPQSRKPTTANRRRQSVSQKKSREMIPSSDGSSDENEARKQKKISTSSAVKVKETSNHQTTKRPSKKRQKVPEKIVSPIMASSSENETQQQQPQQQQQRPKHSSPFQSPMVPIKDERS
ncbi:CLUMA_CG014250, isoform B [Clunio marinus]|uniref:CLUMA_CG014250, isoform B n=1 Tax=Clunio marinus TaxID=568069 RepID=A0A1J1IPF4_9DIPT|nr:CLUMA_CG014250, isoform B [Clunio marinus]